MSLNKYQLEKIWKQLDGALEAIERLQENEIDTLSVDFSEIVSLKNNVEEMINARSRTKIFMKGS